MKVLVTGADGFIGRNLCVHLAERKDVEVVRLRLKTLCLSFLSLLMILVQLSTWLE